MSVTDVFVAPVDEENPSGVELRNDMRFHALERLIAPANHSARDADDGAAPSVDWDEVLDSASELATEGRDLRLLVIVARALTNRDGLPGTVAGLGLLARTVTEYWDSVHPALRDRPVPRDAALRRINALTQIESDDDGILGDLTGAQLFVLPGLGPVTGGDLAAASLSDHEFRTTLASGLGTSEIAGALGTHQARVKRVSTACRALFAEQPERHAGLLNDLENARAALDGLETALDQRLGGNGASVRFTALGKFLTGCTETLAAAAAAQRRATEVTAPPQEDAPMQATATGTDTLPATGTVPDRITSRREVERCLDLIIDFYDRTEPASPIPHLAKRMRKMVPMNFLQLMEEIAPSGMKEFRNIAGVADDKK